MNCLICPVCSEELIKKEKSFVCSNSHSFDIAKQGYVNLLTSSHKDGSLIGDNKDMAVSRSSFLNKGYFDSLCLALCEFINQNKTTEAPTVCDICCGEGYYTSFVKKNTNSDIYAFDISKEMVKLAGKRKDTANFFVANISKIPLKSSSFDFALHLFAPFHESEFARIIKDDGYVLSVIPGEKHLFELKQVLYENPYLNDEKAPEASELTLTNRIKVTNKIKLQSTEDILSLFKMTPYYYRTKQSDKEKVLSHESLEVTTEFVILVYRKVDSRK